MDVLDESPTCRQSFSSSSSVSLDNDQLCGDSSYINVKSNNLCLPQQIRSMSCYISMKSLKSCASCPFSICKQCELDLSEVAYHSYIKDQRKNDEESPIVLTDERGSHIPIKHFKSSDITTGSHVDMSLCVDTSLSSSNLNQILSKTSVFKTRKLTSLSRITECLNCFSLSPKFQLARILEKAWIKLSSSRLSIPFLRPFLPIRDFEDGILDDSSKSSVE